MRKVLTVLFLFFLVSMLVSCAKSEEEIRAYDSFDIAVKNLEDRLNIDIKVISASYVSSSRTKKDGTSYYAINYFFECIEVETNKKLYHSVAISTIKTYYMKMGLFGIYESEDYMKKYYKQLIVNFDAEIKSINEGENSDYINFEYSKGKVYQKLIDDLYDEKN